MNAPVLIKTNTQQRITLTVREDALLTKLAKLMKLSKAQLLKRALGSLGIQPTVSESNSPVLTYEGLSLREFEDVLNAFLKNGNSKEDFLTFTLLDYATEKL